jgi:hypothetical protein
MNSLALSVIVREEVWHFIDADAMQLCVRDFAIETMPDGDGDVFRSRDSVRELRNLMVEVAVVINGDDFALENVLELLEVDDEARNGIDFAGDGHLERVVVAVSLTVGALTEDALVLRVGESRVPVEVRGREVGFTSEEDHRG